MAASSAVGLVTVTLHAVRLARLPATATSAEDRANTSALTDRRGPYLFFGR